MSEKNPILLSFILPMYNVESFLDKCVQSLVQQNLARGTFEIILVNDGSKDNTLVIAKRWASEWPEVKVIDQKNGGQAVARNAGTRLAQGEYLWFIDSDDFILEDSASTLVKVAKAEEADVITFELCKIPVGIEPNARFNPKIEPEKTTSGISFIERHNYNNGPWLFLVRSQFLKEIGLSYKEGRQCEDGMFTMEMLCRANRVVHYPSPAYVYVRHAAGITKNREPAIYRWWLEGFAHAIDFFNGLIEEQSKNPQATPGFLKRLKSRRDSYTFFYCMRLIQSTQKSQEILGTYQAMKVKKWVPLKDFSREEYPGFKYTFFKFMIGQTWTFALLVYSLKLAKLLRLR
jgi:glycosyltransferase involved in cell wall biosynthesis